MIRTKILAGVTIASALILPAPVFAQESAEPSRSGLLNTVEKTVESTVDSARGATKPVAQDVANTVTERVLSKKEQVEARKVELKQEMTKRAEEKKEKLDGQRLARCQNRQSTIDELMVKSQGVGQAKLARIQSFEAALKKFYADQGLVSDSYGTATANADATEAAAIAALEVMDDRTHDCEDVDAKDPAGEIRSLREGKRNALNQYRDSVQELLKVIRAAFAAKEEAVNETE